MFPLTSHMLYPIYAWLSKTPREKVEVVKPLECPSLKPSTILTPPQFSQTKHVVRPAQIQGGASIRVRWGIGAISASVFTTAALSPESALLSGILTTQHWVPSILGSSGEETNETRSLQRGKRNKLGGNLGLVLSFLAARAKRGYLIKTDTDPTSRERGFLPPPQLWALNSQRTFILSTNIGALTSQHKCEQDSLPGLKVHGPVVKTLPFQCRGSGSIPGWRTKIPYATQCGQKEKNS